MNEFNRRTERDQHHNNNRGIRPQSQSAPHSDIGLRRSEMLGRTADGGMIIRGVMGPYVSHDAIAGPDGTVIDFD